LCRARLERSGQGFFLAMGRPVLVDERGPRVWLGLALLKGRTLDEVVRMVTELGVIGLQPFTCERSIPRPDARRSAGRIERWRSIAAQAARQSCRARIPAVETIRSLKEILESPAPGDGFLLHERAEGAALPAMLASAPAGRRFLLVGPEGGFAPPEVELAERAGYRVAGLGMPVLRAQTAAVVAAAFACTPTLGQLDSGEGVE